jgi:glc operon protein GlcG
MKAQLLRIGLLAAAAMGVLAATASAQTVPAKFVVTGAAAEKIMDSTTINLATAEGIVRACERAAEAEKVQISVYVIDNDGNTVYMHRMDGQNWTNVATGEMKAQTALGLRAPSKQMMNDAIANRNDEWQEMKLGLFSNAGGLPIVVNHQMIGAVGVGGSAPRAGVWSDEICAHKALTEVIGPQPPLLEDISTPRTPPTVQGPRFSPTKTPTSSLPPEFVVSGEAAARIFDAVQISGDAARRVAMASRRWAADHNTTMSLAIMDPSGNDVHAERMDGQVSHDIKTAKLKAETARRSRQVTSARYAGVTNNAGGFPRAVELFKFYDQPGGLPIVVDGQMIGAIGVSGVAGGEDEACAVAGLKAVFGDRVALPVYPEAGAR